MPTRTAASSDAVGAAGSEVGAVKSCSSKGSEAWTRHNRDWPTGLIDGRPNASVTSGVRFVPSIDRERRPRSNRESHIKLLPTRTADCAPFLKSHLCFQIVTCPGCIKVDDEVMSLIGEREGVQHVKREPKRHRLSGLDGIVIVHQRDAKIPHKVICRSRSSLRTFLVGTTKFSAIEIRSSYGRRVRLSRRMLFPHASSLSRRAKSPQSYSPQTLKARRSFDPFDQYFRKSYVAMTPGHGEGCISRSPPYGYSPQRLQIRR